MLLADVGPAIGGFAVGAFADGEPAGAWLGEPDDDPDADVDPWHAVTEHDAMTARTPAATLPLIDIP